VSSRGQHDTLAAALVTAALVISAMAVAAPLAASPDTDPTHITFDVPSIAIVMGEDMRHTEWPPRLATPSAEGRFEILLRKTAAPIKAPACHSQFLVVRMPASVSIGNDAATRAAIKQKRAVFNRMMDDYKNDRPIHFDVFAGPYGRKTNGQVILTGCNLFFEEPVAPSP